MQACQHRRFECIQVSYRGMSKCITNFNRFTTVTHIIDALLAESAENHYFTVSDCCLYVESPPYLYPLKPTEYIQDILLRYATTSIHFKLSFKRNSSPSRFAQRKKLLRTPVRQPKLTNAYEQLKIQESLIRKQHEIITQLRKTTLPTNRVSPDYENYFDWVTRTNDEGVDSDDSRSSRDAISMCRRPSRQDEYHQAVNTSRSLSRVRDSRESPSIEVKSILKNITGSRSSNSRTTSVDRQTARVTMSRVKQRRNSVYTSDDADDDNLSDRSTTDSCLGSLSSEDNNSYTVNQHQLETLV